MNITEAQLNELESFFKDLKLPKQVELGRSTTIDDVPWFVKSYLTVLLSAGQNPFMKCSISASCS